MKRLIFVSFITFFMGLVTIDAQTSDLMYSADSCLKQYDIYHALQYYEAACKQNDNAEVRRHIAECYFRRAEYNKCITTLKKISLFNNDSLDHESLREMFYSYQHLSQPSAQLYWGNAIISRYPMDAEVVAKVAELYNSEEINQPQKALELTLGYYVKDTSNVAVLRQYADAFFFMKYFGGAVNIYKRLLSLGDSTYNVLYSLGMCYDQIKNLPLSYKYLKQAADVNEHKNAGCLYRLGIVCVDMGKPEEGIGYLNEAYSILQPDDKVLFIIKRAEGEGYYKCKNWAKAVDAWKETLKYDDSSVATYYNIAQAYGVLNDKENEAEYYKKFIDKASTLEPNDKLTKMIDQAKRKSTTVLR